MTTLVVQEQHQQVSSIITSNNQMLVDECGSSTNRSESTKKNATLTGRVSLVIFDYLIN
jgi:hypothetical protein